MVRIFVNGIFFFWLPLINIIFFGLPYLFSRQTSKTRKVANSQNIDKNLWRRREKFLNLFFPICQSLELFFFSNFLWSILFFCATLWSIYFFRDAPNKFFFQFRPRPPQMINGRALRVCSSTPSYNSKAFVGLELGLLWIIAWMQSISI